MFGRESASRGRGVVNLSSIVRLKVETKEMPLYRSHKLVRALKIKSVSPCKSLDGDEQCIVYFEDESFPHRLFTVSHIPIPQSGWYLVKYDQGYESFSPPGVFEAGNDSIEKLIESAAEAAHEANRILCLSHGDMSQPFWRDAPQWQKESEISGVRAIWNDPSLTPEKSHEGWLEIKRRDGWKWGAVKSVTAKEHPSFLPYRNLSATDRLKNEMFGLVVRAKLGIV